MCKEAEDGEVWAYDKHGCGRTTVSVAWLNWDKVLFEDTIRDSTPSEELLGEPLYGRAWSNVDGDSA